MARTLTFHVPNVFITLSDRDVEGLLVELDRLASFEVGHHAFALAATEIRDAYAQQRHVDDPQPGIDSAIVRALEHLRTRPGFSNPLARLRDALRGKVGASTITYDLDLRRSGVVIDRKVFFSYDGEYREGEPLPPDEEGRVWIVAETRTGDDTTNPKLIVDPLDRDR